jgi:hypothetical protein
MASASELSWKEEVRRIRQLMKDCRVRYVSHIPKKIAPDRVLMHNHVRHERGQQVGVNGFRAWTAIEPYPGFAPCPCGWSGLEHYAMKSYVKNFALKDRRISPRKTK